MRYYKDRWEAVETIIWEEMRALTLEERWQKINTILRFAMESGMKLEADEGEMDVFMRWAKMKAKFIVTSEEFDGLFLPLARCMVRESVHCLNANYPCKKR